LLAVPAKAAENTGVIRGTVTLVGREPVISEVLPGNDADVCGGSARPMQVLTLGTNRAVRDAIVYLGAVAATGNGVRPVVLESRGCEFVPRVQVARSGATLLIRNSDPILHMVRLESLSATNRTKVLVTAAAPYAGFEKKYQLAGFREPALLKATSINGHDWMAGYIAVMPHPWAVLSDGDGRFSLSALPLGTYKLYAWHEVLGTLACEVRVARGRATTVDLRFTGKR
jgi:hypothetical protein